MSCGGHGAGNAKDTPLDRRIFTGVAHAASAAPLSMKKLDRAATLRKRCRLCPCLTVGARISAIFIGGKQNARGYRTSHQWNQSRRQCRRGEAAAQRVAR